MAYNLNPNLSPPISPNNLNLGVTQLLCVIMKRIPLILILLASIGNFYAQQNISSIDLNTTISDNRNAGIKSQSEKTYFNNPAYLTFTFIKNNISIPILKPSVSLIVDNETIQLIDSTIYYIVPNIETNKQFKLTIKYKSDIYVYEGSDSREISKGASICLVKITDFRKIESVASQRNIKFGDNDYYKFCNEYEFAGFMVNLEKYSKAKKAKFIILRPRTYGDGTFTVKYL